MPTSTPHKGTAIALTMTTIIIIIIINIINIIHAMTWNQMCWEFKLPYLTFATLGVESKSSFLLIG
jgi:hypothetical protein